MTDGQLAPIETPRPSYGFVDLLDAEPDLAIAIPAEDLDLARRVLVVPEIVLPRGPWVPERLDDGDSRLGLMVLGGALAHEILLAGGITLRLIGPGDVFDPFVHHDAGPPTSHVWSAHAETRMAALDHRVVAAARRWPELGIALHRRLNVQIARASVQVALAQLARVELRVLAMLWQLADRWGIVTGDGVVIGLRLTHEVLGRLVGARRPTITLALKELGAAGHVRRRDDGRLVLAPGSEKVLTASAR